MAYAPATTVAAPARTALPFGLGSVLAWRNGDRWESGVEFDAMPCGDIFGRGASDCDPEADVIGMPKPLEDFEGWDWSGGEASPFTVYGHFKCSAIGGGFEEAQEKADQRLLAREEARAEQALWTGDLGNVPNFSGAHGYPAPLNRGAFTKPKAALAAVEQGIAEEYGAQGVIHMSRATAILIDAFEVRGGRLYTALGTPVVTGTGYPDGEIVGTPAMFGYRSEIITASARQGDLLDRTNNEMYAIAERTYVIGVDACPLVKATITEETTP